MGNDVELGHGGGLLPAYRACSASGFGPGLIVLHEAAGLADPIRDVCDLLARGGFVALAIDFAGCRIGRSGAAPEAPMTDLPTEQIQADIELAIGALLGDAAVSGPKLGCVGLGAGGPLALLAATHQTRIGAVVDCYGFQSELAIAYEKIEAAVLGIFGEEDETISMDQLEVIREGLTGLGSRAIVRLVPGVGHGFLNEADPEHFRAEAACRTWVEIQNFLRAELR